jgi:hypothetical protein
MRSIMKYGAPIVGVLAACQQAQAHGFAGDHMFISTLLIDDPNVADEASLPTFSFLPNPADEGGATYNTSFELDKRITENFGFAISDGYTRIAQPGGAKSLTGWDNLVVSLKYKPYVNAEHEFMLSVGVEQEFARTGATGSNGAALGNDDSGVTSPNIYFGKGFGDVPVDFLKPFALTGQLGYDIANKKLKYDASSGDFNNGTANAWSGGLTLQYSLRYLSTHVKDFGFPEFVNRLTPVVEMAWSSPASKPNDLSTQFLWGVGAAYTADTYALTVEALIPGNRNTGTHMGVIAQFHLYFDDLFSNSLGKPIVDWFKS